MTALLEQGQRWVRLLSDLLFPPRCVSCQQPGALLCTACIARIVPFPEPRCPRCDLPLPRAGAPCATCRRSVSFLDGMRVGGPHQEPLRGMIHALKYHKRRALALPLGTLLAQRWQAAPAGTVDGILPVPLHPERLRERGFNQSELLAQSVAGTLGVPLRGDLLWRERATVPQVGLSRQERLLNVADAFCAHPDAAGGRWLLVDDVCTTGATLEASAHALREQGACSLWALTLARAYHG